MTFLLLSLVYAYLHILNSCISTARRAISVSVLLCYPNKYRRGFQAKLKKQGLLSSIFFPYKSS